MIYGVQMDKPRNVEGEGGMGGDTVSRFDLLPTYCATLARQETLPSAVGAAAAPALSNNRNNNYNLCASTEITDKASAP